jgi:hypothetical protein
MDAGEVRYTRTNDAVRSAARADDPLGAVVVTHGQELAKLGSVARNRVASRIRVPGAALVDGASRTGEVPLVAARTARDADEVIAALAAEGVPAWRQGQRPGAWVWLLWLIVPALLTIWWLGLVPTLALAALTIPLFGQVAARAWTVARYRALRDQTLPLVSLEAARDVRELIATSELPDVALSDLILATDEAEATGDAASLGAVVLRIEAAEASLDLRRPEQGPRAAARERARRSTRVG